MQKSSPCISRLRAALGTFVAVEAEASSPVIAQQGIAAAFGAISTVERLMHPTRAGSDLAALAACSPGTSLRMHPWTWEVLDLCRRLNSASLGIFDPCLDIAPGRMADLLFERPDRVLARVPLRVDLGGIAKGYAVDRAVEAMQEAGCTGGLINAGGDLAVFGSRSRKILCATPRSAGLVVELRDAALATSDAADTERPREHRGYYHGADRSRAVAGQVTVLAGRAAVADGLTKCLLSADHALQGTVLRAFGAKRIGPGGAADAQATATGSQAAVTGAQAGT